jgi:hypothetical protein
MNGTLPAVQADAAQADAPEPASVKRRQPKTVGGASLAHDKSRDARRLAAAILEVLAGARTPTEAATALGLSLPRYYQVESRALAGLLTACEPRPQGRVASPTREVDTLRQENQRLQREITRHQSLARAAQRTDGWLPAAPPAKTAAAKTSAVKTTGAKAGAKKTRKRRLARALSIAARLQVNADPATEAAVAPTSAVSV